MNLGKGAVIENWLLFSCEILEKLQYLLFETIFKADSLMFWHPETDDCHNNSAFNKLLEKSYYGYV